jgi:hypothetical protein
MKKWKIDRRERRGQRKELECEDEKMNLGESQRRKGEKNRCPARGMVLTTVAPYDLRPFLLRGPT